MKTRANAQTFYDDRMKTGSDTTHPKENKEQSKSREGLERKVKGNQ